MSTTDYLTAREAAALLAVGRATLYAYVSRGLIHSEPFGGGRQRRYRRADIDRLVRRRQGRAEDIAPRGAGDGLLLPSAITLIADGRLSYRGHDATALAEALSLEDTARLLWQADDWDPFAGPPSAPAQGPLADPAMANAGAFARLSPLARLQASLPVAEAADPQAVNHSRRGCARTGARLLLHALDVMVPAAGPVAAAGGRPAPLHRVLACRWRLQTEAHRDGGGADLLRRALVLCADHEFNASTFAARCIAGTGASVYAAVSGALAALRGPRHGGATARVAAMLDTLPGCSAAGGGDLGELDAAIAARLGRGEDLPGFGHPLYPGRDPRAAALLKALAGHARGGPPWPGLAALARSAQKLSDRQPNVDFALVAVCRVLALPPEAPIILFALGRIAGWVAHAEEQYRDGRLVRPRSAYTGPPPK